MSAPVDTVQLAVAVEKPTSPRLTDLFGMDAARQFGESLSLDLKDYKGGKIRWSDIDPGCLFYGPPGTGKTTVARAIAAHCQVGFIATSYAAWTKGESSTDTISQIKETFEVARKNAPCIVFIDEIDSFPRRGYGAHNAAVFTLLTNALLTEVGSSRGVVVIAACNDISNLDPALMRSGRLDQAIEVPLPSPNDLAGIVRYCLGADAHRCSDIDRLALLCVGKSGADIAKMVRKARRIARARKMPLSDEHLELAITEELLKLSPAQRRVIAVHEAGHAAIAYRQKPDSEIVVSLASAAAARSIDHDGALKSREEIEAEMIVLLAGRAAEEVLLGQVTGGAGGTENSDLARASRMALEGIARRGMSAQGHLFWYAPNGAPGLVETTCGVEADAWLGEAYQAAVAQVRHHAVFVAMIAYALIERGALQGSEFAHIDRTMEKVAETHSKADMLAALNFPHTEPVGIQ
ncbi:AAA family ATPase [Bradyrhizobium sp. LMTR 3]|uniref:AAA family ATPase n=1 Tax=Bradyrhizobium sp. LMTR 3 TaxID=189873 RepID=UPI000B1CCC5C|nr:AAA family ATPase [Bradyrhizobium sp. LMTR 3]